MFPISACYFLVNQVAFTVLRNTAVNLAAYLSKTGQLELLSLVQQPTVVRRGACQWLAASRGRCVWPEIFIVNNLAKKHRHPLHACVRAAQLMAGLVAKNIAAGNAVYLAAVAAATNTSDSSALQAIYKVWGQQVNSQLTYNAQLAAGLITPLQYVYAVQNVTLVVSSRINQ